jgi:hypothetical protein
VSRDDSGYSESIKLYPARQIIVFTLTATKGSDTTPPAFPNFTELPPNLHVLSYSDSIGAKAQFAANQTSTPWIFFNDQANSLVISPASNFLLARMCGDAQYNMGVELNSQVKQTSPGFTQSAVMVFGRGMVSTMRAWGQQLAKLKNANDQTGTNNALLTSLGYWSDDAISFDPNLVFNKGYSNNVKTNLEKWRTAGANFGYLELGSWWYPKAGVVKNDRDRLTVLHDAFGWRGIDGVWSYSSSRESLPEGLDPLSRHTDLPLIATGGWIAQESPYRQTYKISGVAPIDSRYWENLSSQLVSQGITCYKQSQLSDIYVKSPAIGEIPGVGDSFTDGMANSFAKRGAALMYDQATPRFFLQAMRYGNIAAIGVSSGALNMDKWSPALYSTILARSAQTRPWLGPLGDIDQKNLLFDLLSGGPIGVMRSPKRSDAGFADGAMALDGTLLAPDDSLLPFDRSIISDSNQEGHAMAAWTYSGTPARAAYILAFTRPDGDDSFQFSPADTGLSGLVYLYNYFRGKGYIYKAGETIKSKLGESDVLYCIAVPIGKNGIAIVGDVSKLVPCASERISAISQVNDQTYVQVNLFPGENSVTITGYGAAQPRAIAINGDTAALQYDAQTKIFSAQARRAASASVDSNITITLVIDCHTLVPIAPPAQPALVSPAKPLSLSPTTTPAPKPAATTPETTPPTPTAPNQPDDFRDTIPAEKK